MGDRPADYVAIDSMLENGVIPIGQPVYVKTVTNYYTGELALLTPQWLLLRNPARIIYDAPSGRHEHEFVSGEVGPGEAEYLGPGIKFISVGAIVDFQAIKKIVTITV